MVESDQTGLGDVWRRLQAGETPEQIRIARGAERSTFVWSYDRTARAIVDGDLPTAPTVALAAARTIRRLLKEHDFSPAATDVLEERLSILEDRAKDPVARAAEERQAKEATAEVEEHAVPGVYVYSLPHYLRYPYDDQSGRTLLKVGSS